MPAQEPAVGLVIGLSGLFGAAVGALIGLAFPGAFDAMQRLADRWRDGRRRPRR
jgi:hypothetical protein